MQKAVFRVAHSGGDFNGTTDLCIQAAIESAARLGGGTVLIGEGQYDIYATIYLRSGVEIRGVPGKTILKQAPQRLSPIARDADLHEWKVTVRDGSIFKPGQSVFLSRPHWLHGFADTVAYVVAVDGDVVYLDRHINLTHEVARESRLVTGGSVVWGENLHDVRISDLIIDGNRAINTIAVGGCVGGGIYLYKVKNADFTDVIVRDYSGDGVSYQGCENVNLLRCQANGCAVFGLHPGSGTTGTTLIDCTADHNGSDGIFFCWRATQGVVDGCRARFNSRMGFCIGHKDENNVIRNSEFSNNGMCGMFWRNEPEGSGANHVLVENNRIADNGGSAEHPDYIGVRLRGATEDVRFINNTIEFTDEKAKKRSIAFVIEPTARDIVLEGNRLIGCAAEVQEHWTFKDKEEEENEV